MFAMVYSLIEVLTFPVMFCKGRSLCIASDGPFSSYRPIGVPLVSLYCGSFGMCISLLALHFFYRYIAVCKPDKLYYFEGKRIIYTLIPCYTILVIWTSNVYFLMSIDAEKEAIYQYTLLPLFTMYLPAGCFIILPIFGIELGAEANKTGAFIGVYPALDPLIAILLIKEFRSFIFCQKKSLAKVSTTTGRVDKPASTFQAT
ncbi:hypothetical protein GCK72_024951 [Caenorhabditis remanei]|uniref:Uncharacterized protein n=1 Tax=Caenorhabditis remanei TaxID=31234 RepID=A0A6A5G1H9_CAERE|nr:hypothetical protein GCK72_024951 [Caenorhabditis remanei]KAF1748484.1 hypothetical protein GCK72_024951 [Caenorhabditis remanei]